MGNLKLIIGNKNYSSWSLRPWLFMKVHNISFEEIRIPLYTANTKDRLAPYSPSGLVPVLIDGDVTVWDSLAILEYLSETRLHGNGWPSSAAARAEARSVSAEMHAGFSSLRKHLSMNVRARFQWRHIDDTVERELSRIFQIWEGCLSRHGGDGPWLFGAFSIADAMYAPVCLRLDRYNVPVNSRIRAYMNQTLTLQPMREWCAAAYEEKEVIGWAENAELLRIEQ